MSHAHRPSPSAERGLDELKEILEHLDLLMYLETFMAAGFHTWDSLMNITEAELYDS